MAGYKAIKLRFPKIFIDFLKNFIQDLLKMRTFGLVR